MTRTPTTLPCPHCGAAASATLRREPGRTTGVEDFRCPNGCEVDEESLRQVVSTSDN